jgi:predicted adenine nucleotide alpha hydrolase (AANH) superfamily ATPase
MINPGLIVEQEIRAMMRRYIDQEFTFAVFEGDYGYAEWMAAYTDAAEGEPMSDSECEAIHEYLLMLWGQEALKAGKADRL